MRNFRFPISDQFSAANIAKDLQVQLEINRFSHVNVVAADNRNEVIVQVPEANEGLEEAVESFMKSYQTGVILE
ncbi:hypothetical protein [Bacillus sp. EB600]|uniref:hypothetical protein n=1 Tax=Bacillus sp. EB600 TaxID=2806345 RepID=UPI00210C1243|nr:hypothetical protein [Bacillus sp. EB600]MCQ6282076.1 hypothetical protein [Bacillus sp. EB600]